MSSSAFVLDWSRPVPLDEFFVPLTEVTLPAYRACTQMVELKIKRWRITRLNDAAADEQWFSSARSLHVARRCVSYIASVRIAAAPRDLQRGPHAADLELLRCTHGEARAGGTQLQS